MERESSNITEICKTNPIELNDEEREILRSGQCGSFPKFTSGLLFLPTGYVVYYSLLVCCGFVLNLLVMLTIFSRTRLRTVPNVFMISLSVAGFLMATVTIPLRIAERLNDNKQFSITVNLYELIAVASILSLCFVTLDRYIHIRNPLNYSQYMNKSRAIGIVAGLWIFSTLQASVSILVDDSHSKKVIYNDIRIPCFLILPTIFISVAYTKLFLVAKAHVRVIATTTATIPQPGHVTSQKKDFKILKIITLIVGTFVICWFPFLFSITYLLHTEERPSINFLWFFNISECVTCSTCVLNPLIYGFLRRDLRMSMKYVARCKRESIEETESL